VDHVGDGAHEVREIDAGVAGGGAAAGTRLEFLELGKLGLLLLLLGQGPHLVVVGEEQQQQHRQIFVPERTKRMEENLRKRQFFTKTHCKKRLAIFPSPAGMSLTKLSLAGCSARDWE
jgi:hypothetical protein